MYHIQFCPVSADQAVLKFPSVPDRGLIVTQVRQHCMEYHVRGHGAGQWRALALFLVGGTTFLFPHCFGHSSIAGSVFAEQWVRVMSCHAEIAQRLKWM